VFFPLKDENPTRRKPILTVTLIVINVLVFLYSYLRPARAFQYFIVQYGLIPYELVHLTELTPELSAPILATPFTSMFMHGGILHLGGNMLYLWIFGNNIEDYFGPVRFIIFYLVAGLAAALLFIAFSPSSNIPMVGASGAVSGVLGAYLVLYPRARVLTLVWIFYFIRLVHLPAKFLLGFWFFYQLLMSLMATAGGGGVAWMAHIGGFAFGFLVLRLIVRKRRRAEIRID
jgi:membrane associated rhomboid family serine protease